MLFIHLLLYILALLLVSVLGSAADNVKVPWKRFHRDVHPQLARRTSIQQRDSTANVTENEPPPRKHLRAWVAFGDSFSAGPGAGPRDVQDQDSCYRHEGAYPRQLANSFLFRHEFLWPYFKFESCTGDVINDVTDKQIPELRNALPGVDLVTLSIGGNNIKFSDMVAACIVGATFQSCDEAVNTGRDRLYSVEFWNQYIEMLQSLEKQLQWCNEESKREYDCETIVYQTAYPSFFESYTTQCNDKRLVPVVPAYLTQELRSALNQLTQEMNVLLAYYAAQFNEQIRRRNVFPSDRTRPDFIVSHASRCNVYFVLF